MHFIGIDIGTSSISGVIYNIDNKNIESVTLDNDAAIISSHCWEKIQDTERIIQLVRKILDTFCSRYADIKGIGITGQMHGILYVDGHGNAVSPLYTWQDNRASQIYKNNKSYVTFLSEESGYPLATGYGLVTHFYNNINHLIPDNACKICTIMDYAVMKLSGRKEPVTDCTNGASLGFFDVEKSQFDEAALSAVGIDISILPELTKSTAKCGNYNNTIPVYSAIGDNQAAFLGSVDDIYKSIHITVGTSSQISVYSDNYIQIPTLDTRPFPGGGYILVGAALCGGEAFALLKTFFEKTLQLFSSQTLDKNEIYRIMTSIPYKENIEDLPVVETLFDGTRYAPGKRGKIDNLSLTNTTPENLILGFLKGISRELFDFYNKLPEKVKSEKEFIIGSGNGLKRNQLLCKAFEEQFSCKVKLSPHHEEAAYGACINAMTAGGYMPESFYNR